MLTSVLQATGLQTNTNKLSVQAGGLVQATNCVIQKKDVVEIRRGLNPVGTTFAFAGSMDNLFLYQNRLLASNGTALAYDSAANASSPVWTNYSGSYVPPSGANKIHAVEGVNSNLYFSTSSGVGKLDVVTGTPYAAGGVKALDGTATLQGAAGWLVNNSNVAYQIVWGYYDVNNNLVLGDPSQLISLTNSSGGTRNATLVFTVPSGLTTSYFWQLYRSAQTSDVNVVAGQAFQLVAQTNLTAGQIAALQVTYTDQTPDTLKGSYLYSDATQQGPLQTNDPPPLCVDLCFWKNMMFYANCSSKQRAYATMISVGGLLGVQVGDTFVITSGVTTLTYTGNAAQNVATHLFKVDGSSTPAANIAATAQNLVACINQDATNTLVYAFYISGYNQLPGQILLEERAVGGAVFTLTSSNGAAYGPALPAAGTTYASTNNTYLNGVMVSKVNQPEAVPLVNLFFVGAADQPIRRILALTDAVYALKDDGVYRITGDTPSNLVVTIAYPDTIITVYESAAVLNNSIYAYTNQGIVTINQSEPQLVSFPIEDTLLPLQTYASFNTSFGVSYPSDREYIFCTLTNSTDTKPSQAFVYNYITQTWTGPWDQAFTGGLMSLFDKRLYFCSNTKTKLVQERKSYTVMDYADDSFTCNVVNFSGKIVQVDSSANAVIGYSLAQTNAINPNYPTTSVITAIGDATHVTVTDNLTWAVGAAAYYKPINCTVGYAPAHGGFPLYLKHWGTLEFMMESLTASSITGKVSSDLYPYFDSFPFILNLLGYGMAPYGNEVFGGVSFSLQPLRVYVPINEARSHWINVYLNQNEALRKFSIAGATAEFDITSSRMK